MHDCFSDFLGSVQTRGMRNRDGAQHGLRSEPAFRSDESGRVSFQRAYTTREYLLLFADRPGVQSELAVFVDALDEHWYAERPAGPERYDRCLSLYQHLTTA